MPLPPPTLLLPATKRVLMVYTDASIMSGGRGGLGLAVALRRVVAGTTYSSTAPQTTYTAVSLPVSGRCRDVNMLELAAILTAVEVLDPRLDVVIHTDSAAALRLLTRPVTPNPKYARVVRAILATVAARPGATAFRKVKGHCAREPGNACADAAARRAATTGAVDGKGFVLDVYSGDSPSVPGN